MEVNQRTIGDVVILDANGEIDLYSSPRLRTALIELIENDPERPSLLINLTGVRYIDSSGLATLIEGLQKAQEKGMKLALFGLSDHVREVFRLARLDNLFEIHESEQDALRQLERR